jgi:UDP-glucose 4-epimerase
LHWSNGEVESSNLSQLSNISGVPDAIYHLAGGSTVGASFQSPHEDFSRTVETTARLLEWVRLNSPQSKVVSVSSAAVYGTGHVERIPEDARLSPSSPYGHHKAMMEELCQVYADNFGLQIAIVRLFSIYGARLQKQLIWDLCCKLAATQSGAIVLGGTGDEVRDWLHVSDAAEMLWLTHQACSTACPVINGGTGIGTRIADIVNLVCHAWGASSEIEFSGNTRRGDPFALVADVGRAGELGFRPLTGRDRGIRQTVEWFKGYWSRSSSA